MAKKSSKSDKGEKKSKKAAKAAPAYPGLSKKVPSDCCASASHMVNDDSEVKVTYADGDRPAESSMSVDMQVVSAGGLRFERNFRGKDELVGMSGSAVIMVTRKLGKGKGTDFDKIPWPKAKAPAWASEHIGERVALRYSDGGRTQVVKNALIGCVDEVGVGFAFAAYGQERLGWIPLTRLVDITVKMVDDSEGDAEEEE